MCLWKGTVLTILSPVHDFLIDHHSDGRSIGTSKMFRNAVKVSKHRLVIQKFGLSKPVRVCDLCHDVLTQKTLTSGYTQNNWFYAKVSTTGSSTIWPEVIIFKFIHLKIIASKNTVNAQRSIFAHMYIINNNQCSKNVIVGSTRFQIGVE